LKAWGAYGKTHSQWYDDDDIAKEQGNWSRKIVIKTTSAQDQALIDFVLKDQSHLTYVYCVNRADEILTAGGLGGIYGANSSYGAFTAGSLLDQVQMQTDLGRTGVLQLMLDNMVDEIADPNSSLHGTD
jgi:hypothetical protein